MDQNVCPLPKFLPAWQGVSALIAAAFLSRPPQSLRLIEKNLRPGEPESCAQFRAIVDVESLIKFSSQIRDGRVLQAKFCRYRRLAFAKGELNPNLQLRGRGAAPAQNARGMRNRMFVQFDRHR